MPSVALALHALMLSFCSTAAAATDRPSPPEQSFTLQWNGPINAAAAGAIVAVADGIFQREGLRVSLVPGASDAAAIKAAVADDYVIAHVSALSFIRARDAGQKLVAFASSYISSSVELYALAKTKLDGPADLVGKTISSRADTDAGSILESLTVKYALPRSQMMVRNADSTTDQLLAGTVDVLPGHWENEGLELRRSGMAIRTLNPGAFGIHSPGTLYVVSEKTIRTRTDAVVRFVAALLSGWDAVYADPGRTAPLFADSITPRLSPAEFTDLLNQQRRYVRPLGARMGELDVVRLRELQNVLLRQRLVSRPASFGDAIDSSIVQEVYRAKARVLRLDR